MIVAWCPKCGGWTMFHLDENSKIAKTWARDAELWGELVGTVGDNSKFGKSCTQADKRVQERTCEP